MAYSPPISGIDGAFYLDTTGGTPTCIANIRSWSIDLSAEEVDVSGFCSDGWRETVGGLKSWNASVEGQWNYGATSGMDDLWDSFGGKVDVQFYIDGSTTGDLNYFTGTATVTAISPTTSVDSSATFTATLSGDGELTYATG
jgi:predicted secreted protein